MAALLTLAQIREHVETDLGDDALQRIIDDADAAIVARFGAHTSQTDYVEGGERRLFPGRPIGSITTITETVIDAGGNKTDTNLSADDYTVLNGGRVLERSPEGTNPRSEWGTRIKIIHTPVAQSERRKRVTIDLVKLAVAYDGKSSERAGDYSVSHKDYQTERNRILSELFSGGGRLLS